MKILFPAIAAISFLSVSADLLAEPRLMKMLDDAEMTETRVEYFTELKLNDNEESNRDKAQKRNETPGITSMPERSTPQPMPVPSIESRGVSVEVHAH